jgi:hypothetical protein
MGCVPVRRTSSAISNAVARIAVDLRAQADVSPVELVRASGYLQDSMSVTIETIRAVLATHPDWVAAWLAYSQDKRTDSGWYVTQDGASGCLVGYYPGAEPDRFHDCVHACAVFVDHEIADIAANLRAD